MFLHRQKALHQHLNEKGPFEPYHDDDDEEEDSLSQRDSFPLGAGCLPCTPKSSKKTPIKHFCKHHSSKNSSNWCCGVVANTVKKTAKKL